MPDLSALHLLLNGLHILHENMLARRFRLPDMKELFIPELSNHLQEDMISSCLCIKYFQGAILLRVQYGRTSGT